MKKKGVKYDEGKPDVFLVIESFPKSILEIAKVATFGCKKYTRGGWKSVKKGEQRYRAAAGRHELARLIEGEKDSESNLLHEAHEIWSRLAAFELRLNKNEKMKKTKNPEVILSGYFMEMLENAGLKIKLYETPKSNEKEENEKEKEKED